MIKRRLDNQQKFRFDTWSLVTIMNLAISIGS